MNDLNFSEWTYPLLLCDYRKIILNQGKITLDLQFSLSLLLSF